MKLIKLLENHYVIVDDSLIRERNIKVLVDKKLIATTVNIFDKNLCEVELGWSSTQLKSNCKRIIGSTQPLEEDDRFNDSKSIFGGKTLETINDLEKEFSFYPYKLIPLSEVEELIYGYSVENIVKPLLNIPEEYIDSEDCSKINFGIKCFNAHKEISKDKLFTIHDMRKAYEEGMLKYLSKNTHDTENFLTWENFMRTMLPIPKTEWEVKFDENGKLKLKKD